MRYLGSKTSLLQEIWNIVEDYKKEGVFCDPFGGIGTVGGYMKKKGYQVITGDILYFAHCFQTAIIENNGEVSYKKVKEFLSVDTDSEIEDYLNTLSVNDGWLINEYARKRKYFTEENAKHIQASIDCIQYWKTKGILNDKEYKVMIASLIQSFDKVANTAGTYYAFLKEYYRKAKRPFDFKFIQPYESKKTCNSYCMSAEQLVEQCECDILYLDPPYNERNYGRYYHLPENIAKGITPIPEGKSGIYVKDLINSSYNKKSEATEKFNELIDKAKSGCIIFHYTDDGLIKVDDARKILRKKGKVEEFYFDCKGYNTVTNMEGCRHHIIRVIRDEDVARIK